MRRHTHAGHSSYPLRAGLSFLGAVLAVTIFFALTVEGMAFASWRLTGADEVDLAALRAMPQPERRPTRAVHENGLAEWDPARGRGFSESPFLRTAEAGLPGLPPVAERLPANPLVAVPWETKGPYGGTWQMYGTDAPDIRTYISSRINYESFLRWSTMGDRLLPCLASRWEVSPDDREFTLYLRRGVRWSDGAPFGADDVEFWYRDVLMNDELTPAKTREFRQGADVADFTRLDNYTVRFTFARPNGIFLADLAMGANIAISYPAHYLRRYHETYADPAELKAAMQAGGFANWRLLFAERADVFNKDCPRLWAWTFSVPPPSQPVVLHRNPYYWKVDPTGAQLPYIDRIVMDVFERDAITLRSIQGDIGVQGRHLTARSYPLLASQQRAGNYTLRHWVNAAGGMNVLGINENHRDPTLRAIIHDDRFRKALSLAINRPEMNEVTLYGLGVPRQVSPPPSSPFYDEAYSNAWIAYDPARASALLDEIGLTKRNRHGVRLRPDGKPLTLLIESVAMSSDLDALLLIAEYWTAVGVKTDVKSEARPLFYNRKNAWLHDVATWYGADEQNPLLDPRWFLPFTTESLWAVAWQAWLNTDGRAGEEPPPDVKKCWELFQQAKATSDTKRQIALFHQIMDINRKHLWTVGTLGEVPELHLVNNNFRNVPEVAISGWSFRTPGNTSPECYSIAS